MTAAAFRAGWDAGYRVGCTDGLRAFRRVWEREMAARLTVDERRVFWEMWGASPTGVTDGPVDDHGNRSGDSDDSPGE